MRTSVEYQLGTEDNPLYMYHSYEYIMSEATDNDYVGKVMQIYFNYANMRDMGRYSDIFFLARKTWWSLRSDSELTLGLMQSMSPGNAIVDDRREAIKQVIEERRNEDAV